MEEGDRAETNGNHAIWKPCRQEKIFLSPCPHWHNINISDQMWVLMLYPVYHERHTGWLDGSLCSRTPVNIQAFSAHSCHASGRFMHCIFAPESSTVSRGWLTPSPQGYNQDEIFHTGKKPEFLRRRTRLVGSVFCCIYYHYSVVVFIMTNNN